MASAQKLATRSGYVKFFSDAAVEDITAENNQVSSVIDMSNGKFAFLVPIKGFVFEKALMQEHFNENYMESGKFPNGSFKGEIVGFDKIDFTKDGTMEVNFKGIMEIHGVQKEVDLKATITIKDGKVSLSSKFMVGTDDYGIKIPSAKKDNISNSIEVTVKMDYAKK